MELAKNHDVTVITDISRRAALDAPDAPPLPSRLRIVFYRPAYLMRLRLNSSTAQVLYLGWQFGLFGIARKLHAQFQFDLALHCTYSVFRHPSFLGYLGIPFIFGPLGGGEDAPGFLKRTIRGSERVREMIRTCLNKFALVDPMLWVAYRKATVVLVSTHETKSALPWPFRRKAIVYSNLGVDASVAHPVLVRSAGEPLKLVFVGRLLGLKGIHLGLQALAISNAAGAQTELTIVGSGPYEKRLRHAARSLGVESAVTWTGALPQKEVFRIYRRAHALLFPSLHDSGGTVVLEAQLNGLPVICLDLGGPPTLVGEGCGLIVPAKGGSARTVVDGLAQAICRLANDEPFRQQLASSAIEHVQSMTWERRVGGVLQLLNAPAERGENA